MYFVEQIRVRNEGVAEIGGKVRGREKLQLSLVYQSLYLIGVIPLHQVVYIYRLADINRAVIQHLDEPIIG